MKKTISALLVVAVLSAVIIASFAGCDLFKSISLDEVQANLKEAGYEVTVLTGKEYVESEDKKYDTIMEFELNNYLYAVKGKEEIHMYFFASTDIASYYEDSMTIGSTLYTGQSNELVYLGTKQARKDAKL